MTKADRISPIEWLACAADSLLQASKYSNIEQALSCLTACAQSALGDRSAASRTGAMKKGERDYRVAGVFLIAPDRQYNVLVANQGFPTEQRRLSIPISWNHPGTVVETNRYLLLENTDEHGDFRQFLKSSKMGSSIYVPIIASHGMVGQIVAAAQARWTYSSLDVAPMRALAAAAALIWEAKNGEAWWANDYPASDAWYANKQQVDQ